MQHKLRLFYRKLKQGECHETSPADTGFLCDRCAVFVVAIKETPCNFLSVVYSLFYLESFFLSGDFHVRHPIVFLIINIIYIYTYIYIYRVSQEECEILQESVPYVKLYRYNPKHLCPKLNGYGDNGQRKVWTSCISAYCISTAVSPLTLQPHLPVDT